MIKIQKAEIKDVPFFLPLIESYWRFEGVPGFDSKRIEVQLKLLFSYPSLGAGWIAMMEGAAVGYLLAVYVFSLEHFGLTAEIDEFFVLPPHRGQGVGKTLLNTAEHDFVRTGCTNVSLQLSRGNDSARGFYHHRGYTDRSTYELLEKALHGTL